MKIEVTQTGKLVAKNAKIEMDEDNNVLLIEDTKDGVETNDLFGALATVFGNKRYDITFTLKEEV